MIKRTKVVYTNVQMELLGQIRLIDDIEVTIEEDTKTGKVNRILSFKELSRLEEREHIKIMKNYRKNRPTQK